MINASSCRRLLYGVALFYKANNQTNNDWPILVQKFDTLKILASFAHRLR